MPTSSPNPKPSKLKRTLPLALILAAGVVIFQIIGFSSSAGVVNGKTIVAALFIGLVSFPVALGLAWLVMKEPKATESRNVAAAQNFAEDSVAIAQPKKATQLSKWNYVGVALGVSAILGLFLPKLFNGSLQGKDFIGLGFWMIVIAITGKNILDHLRAKKA